MSPAEFAKRRERILHHSQGRSDAWRKRAMKQLANEAGAQPQHTKGKRVIAWRLNNGKHVCIKHRYPSVKHANDALEQMQREPDGRRKPIRAYPCYFCNGWHITSQSRDAA